MAQNSIASDFDGASEDEVHAKVLRALYRVCEAEGLDPEALTSSASLVGDLGMDSLVFVEVILALEDELGVVDFPLQTWADEEARRPQGAFTLASLVAYARRWIRDRSP